MRNVTHGRQSNGQQNTQTDNVLKTRLMAHSWQTSTAEMLSLWKLCCEKNVITNMSKNKYSSTDRQNVYQHRCCFNLHYECTCLFSCMLSSRMHCTAACVLRCVAPSPLVEPFPTMTTSVWSPVAAA